MGKDPHLAFYSSIRCEPTFGGPLQIYRHFREHDDFTFHDLNGEKDADLWSAWLGSTVANNPLLKRLLKTRFYPWFLSRAYNGWTRSEIDSVIQNICNKQVDAMVTVAYGRRCMVAREVARRLKLPLITFFHDWWPDLVFYKTSSTSRWLDRRFRDLAHSSDLVLSVSDELLKELKNPESGVCLPPIPSQSASAFTSASNVDEGKISNDPLIVYTGTLNGPYGQMVLDLAKELQGNANSSMRVRFYGGHDWDEATDQMVKKWGVFGGYVSGNSLTNALNEADTLLIVMDFDKDHRRRVRTSFPSKILDYMAAGKSLSVWGPADCFAAKFVTENDLGFVYTGLYAKGFVDGFKKYWNSHHSQQAVHNICELRESYSNTAIQSKLCEAMNSLLDNRKHSN